MKITILNTGGTFNKRYNPIKGELEVPKDHVALEKMMELCHNVELDVQDIVSKDSLDMTDGDRETILNAINKSDSKKFIIVHGTDTIDITADFLDKNVKDKVIVLTGTMVPMSIEKIEATMNFSLALGYLGAEVKSGIYVAMHGVVAPHEQLKKDKSIGKFLLK